MKIDEYPMKSWSRLCKSRNENLYDLLKRNNVSIWHTRFKSEFDTLVTTQYCKCCGKVLDFKHMNGRWRAVLCDCVKDNKKQLTIEKLKCFLEETCAINIIKQINNAKTKKFKSKNQYWIDEGYSDLEASLMLTEYQKSCSAKSADLRRGTNEYSPASAVFWIKKGYSEVDTKNKVIENQKRGKYFFIKKYGEEKGIQKWQDRQIKWMNSMKKSSMVLGHSAIADDLFQQVAIYHPDIHYGKNEKEIKVNGKVYWLDCLLEEKKLVIEFYGDYWHGNPSIYNDTYEIKRGNKTFTVMETHEADRLRVDNIGSRGYQVKVVWENDYRKNKEAIIQECIAFLNGE